MPWVNQDMCVGCGICVNECPVDAITQPENDKAVINDGACIRCGKCHDVCLTDAVRHDSERIPDEVAENMEKTKNLLMHYDNPAEQQGFIERMIRFFNKQRKVADLTIGELTDMKNNMENAQ
jgi:formate hydrogenlyase subunit 6/NADH:ubiquinone oxidoreductase subunit I